MIFKKRQKLFTAWNIDIYVQEDTPDWAIPFICLSNSFFLLAWTPLSMLFILMDHILNISSKNKK